MFLCRSIPKELSNVTKVNCNKYTKLYNYQLSSSCPSTSPTKISNQDISVIFSLALDLYDFAQFGSTLEKGKLK